MRADLSVPQYLYLGVVAAYLLMFVLFLRLLVWKRYADRYYWRRRPPLSVEGVRALARSAGRDLPYFSILVPARNEADVIERTVDHMARLDYPPDRFEIIVITDEKESEAADRIRPDTVAAAARFLRSALRPAAGGPAPAEPSRPGGPSRAGATAPTRTEPKVIALAARKAVGARPAPVAAAARPGPGAGTGVAVLPRPAAVAATLPAAEPEAAVAAAPAAVPEPAAPLPEPAPAGPLPHVEPVSPSAAGVPLSPAAEGLVLGLLGRLAGEGGDEIRRRYLREGEPGALRRLPQPVVRYLVWEAAHRLWAGRGRTAGPGAEELLRRRLPGATREEILAAHAALLGRAIPAVVALAQLRDEPHRRRLVDRMAAHAARANHTLTREILRGMSEALAADILGRLARLAHGPDGQLERLLEETYREIYPTTQDILQRKVAEFARRRDVPRLKHVDVPVDFDGELGGRRLGRPVPSTKGRALNWGLGFVDPRTRWCGFYDAESRPDPRVLLYVARRWLEDLGPARPGWRPPRVERPVRIFQGPVFQVRNFFEMGPFCKIASLYQAIAHDWYLPSLFRRLPFVGGTNLFVDVDLLRQIGGYDARTLTEDLELGTRAYLRAGAWPEYLPLPSSEQTPPTFRSFFRQRLRWATGHLQVMAKLQSDSSADPARRRELLQELWRKGQFEWVFYQTATLVPPIATVLYWAGWLDPSVLWAPARSALYVLSLIYVAFTVYAYFRYLPYLDRSLPGLHRLRQQAAAVASLLLLPLAAFLFPVPYSTALALYAAGRGPREWVKTPRTRE
ncbi:glycosyltransferase family 2 protein [Caldinitratiruptor microaerophilus]|uniref:glycosyltransferase family 2 protein n=1 Tax=Caldinitratiruptor microaerophilus TaxID=671077 RepID=UPI002230DD78|nr:glycosyltransferase family 2 protein [Caldinitratiruptor microaerophilus]